MLVIRNKFKPIGQNQYYFLYSFTTKRKIWAHLSKEDLKRREIYKPGKIKEIYYNIKYLLQL